MPNQDKYLIGFDRYIDLHWANQAYFLLKQQSEYYEKVESLKAFLSNYISGKDSIRKTANLLSRIWFKDYHGLESLKNKAIDINALNKGEFIVLHFGMGIVIFPFFKEVLSQIGNLLFIQGFFYSGDIESRMMGRYSNISSVPRATQRIVQSINSWGLIKKENDKRYIQEEKISINNPRIISWILRSIVLSTESKRQQLSEIMGLNFLFPFQIDLKNSREVYLNSEMAIERDGMNNEYIILRE